LARGESGKGRNGNDNSADDNTNAKKVAMNGQMMQLMDDVSVPKRFCNNTTHIVLVLVSREQINCSRCELTKAKCMGDVRIAAAIGNHIYSFGKGIQ
jgi:hypothetical protein